MEEEDEYEDSIIVVQIDARIDKKKQMKMFVIDSNQKRIKDLIHQYME